MSADNGIYILKTKDQYRVVHFQGIGHAYWSAIDGQHDSLVPTRVIEIWGDCKFTRDELKAYRIAHSLARKLPICEYGVNILTYNKTWKQLLMEARDYAEKEINYIKNTNEERFWDINKLHKIANGYYFYMR